MKNPLLVPEVRELLRKKKYTLLKSFFSEQHAREAAEYLSSLEPKEIWQVMELLDPYQRAEMFSYMEMEVQVDLIEVGLRRQVQELLKPMSHDDRADLFQHLDKNVADKMLLYLPQTERKDVLHLTSYQDGTCGAIMTTDFVALSEKDTVEKALRYIRSMAPSRETIYYTYVIDEKKRLIGFVSLRKLILAQPRMKIGAVMRQDVISANALDDQEQAARTISHYDLIALPVVDNEGILLGIITYDDAMDILREEQTEDLEKLMAISGSVSEKPYLEIPIMTHFRKRVFWVLVLGVCGLLTGMIIQGFQDTLESLIILTFYMPLLNAAGGNTGSQSATVVLRSLALNELKPQDVLHVIKKEFWVSLMLAVCLGLMTYVRVLLLSGNTNIAGGFDITMIAFVISLALAIQIVWSTVFGAVIPLLATRLKIDPAVFSSPALTTLVDMGGITIYFTCAKLILGI